MRKTIYMLSLTLILSVLFTINQSIAQISYGGQPESFKQNIKDNFDVKEFSKIDISTIEAEDEIRDSGGELYRYGVAVKAGLNLENSGTWTSLPNGDRIWRLKILAHEALAIGVNFDDFWLPEGTSMFLYNEGKTQVIGSFTHLNNHPSGIFATELIYGESATIEYYEPSDVWGKAIISISEFAYAYRSVYDDTHRAAKAYEDSDPCEVDAVCSEGNNWRDQIKGVARISVKEGTTYGWCSGSLVNNTLGDCMPYFLTADHCAGQASIKDVLSWVFYFEYERTGCNDTNEPEPVPFTITGAVRKARGGWTGSDFYLVLFTSYLPTQYDVFFNGWRAYNTSSPSGVCIHHPAGDIKKISTYDLALANDGNTHWRVRWAATTNGHGVTEGGSSGSPIFNNLGLIAGTLTGGLSACITDGAGTGTGPTKYDSYGKFSYSWQNNGVTASARLKDWLDPPNLVPDTIHGKYQNCTDFPLIADFYVEQLSVPINTNIEFLNLTLKNPGLGTSYLWEFEGTSQSPTSPIPSPTRLFNQAGTFPVTLTATNAEMSDSKTVYITVLPNGVSEINPSSFKLFPNPAHDLVTIELDETTRVGSNISIYNMVGEEIISGMVATSRTVQLDVSDFNAGMYFVKVTSEKSSFTQKLTLVK
ncbi:MAG: T9SS type A sorting domain-containing protein [Bacteroidales bacterium]|nr:T9SS type A sorting domain-containing protein [Bacteroidales bacterium]MCF8457054.1 T9SS type A sorting domain-containing protein [Bacteroidales bacterium]